MSLPSPSAVKPFIVKKWPTSFTGRYGHSLPRDYLVVDLETNGLDKQNDLILEIGHCVVRDGKPQQVASTLIDWTRADVDQHRLVDQMNNVRRYIETGKDGRPTGRKYHITYDRLKNKGIPPEEAFGFYHRLFEGIRSNGGYFVGQNIYRFDSPFITNSLRKWAGVDFQFGDNEVFDIGTMEKAHQLGQVPKSDDTLSSYFTRVANMRRKGVKWSIEYMLDKYSIDKMYNLDLTKLHTAGADCYCSALIFEAFRDLSR